MRPVECDVHIPYHEPYRPQTREHLGPGKGNDMMYRCHFLAHGQLRRWHPPMQAEGCYLREFGSLSKPFLRVNALATDVDFSGGNGSCKLAEHFRLVWVRCEPRIKPQTVDALAGMHRHEVLELSQIKNAKT